MPMMEGDAFFLRPKKCTILNAAAINLHLITTAGNACCCIEAYAFASCLMSATSKTFLS